MKKSKQRIHEHQTIQKDKRKTKDLPKFAESLSC